MNGPVLFKTAHGPGSFLHLLIMPPNPTLDTLAFPMLVAQQALPI